MKYLVYTETGERWEDWDDYESTAGGWSHPAVADYLGAAPKAWTNNPGTGIRQGFSAFRKAYVANRFRDEGFIEDHHVTHMVMTVGNSSAEGGFGLGPATAITSGGNGYAVAAYWTGSVSTLVLARLASWVPTVLANDTVEVHAGDVVSLSYYYFTSLSGAVLQVFVNGELKLNHTDTGGSAIRMSSVSGRPGLYGSAFPTSLLDTLVVGHFTPQWWVTEGTSSGSTFERPPTKSERTAEVRVVIQKRQQFADDDTPTMRYLFGGNLLKCSWSHKPIGGSTTMSAEIRFPDVVADVVSNPESLAEDLDAKHLENPSFTDWKNADWIGGDLIVEYYHKDDRPTDPVTYPQNPDCVWRGVVSKISYDLDTEVFRIQGQGLVKTLDELFFVGRYEKVPIIDIIEEMFNAVRKQNASSFWGDTRVLYDPARIVGDTGLLSYPVTIDFQWESVASAMGKLLEYLPPGVVWGVDLEGYLYLDQTVPHYDEDWGGAGVQHFQVDGRSVSFSKELDFGKMKSNIQVLGKERPDGDERAVGDTKFRAFAVANRMKQLIGNRGSMKTDGAIRDSGAAQKVAIATLKQLASPPLTAQLAVTTPIYEDRELWQATVRAPTRVSVSEREGDHSTDEREMRFWGDRTAYRCNDLGSAGASMSIASTTGEQALNKAWLMHATMTFDNAHPAAGTPGQFAFLFGRPEDTISTYFGWGGLWWNGLDGLLYWIYTTSTNALRVISTGITVTPASPGGTVVHFTVARDSTGDWFFYNGNTQTATSTSYRTDVLKSTSYDWRFWDHNRSISAYIDGDVSFEQFWLYDMLGRETYIGGSSYTALIADMHDHMMRRHQADGLLLWFAMHEQGSITSPATTLSHKGFRLSGGVESVVDLDWTPTASADVTLEASTSNAKLGVKIGSQKKWGGPLVMDVHQTKFEVDGATGLLTRRFTLGLLPENLFTTIGRLDAELKRIEEDRRRNENIAP